MIRYYIAYNHYYNLNIYHYAQDLDLVQGKQVPYASAAVVPRSPYIKMDASWEALQARAAHAAAAARRCVYFTVPSTTACFAASCCRVAGRRKVIWLAHWSGGVCGAGAVESNVSRPCRVFSALWVGIRHDHAVMPVLLPPDVNYQVSSISTAAEAARQALRPVSHLMLLDAYIWSPSCPGGAA